MKLYELLKNNKVESTGFPAIAGIGVHSTGSTPAVLSSLPAAALHAQGITRYFTLVLPRGSKFETAEEIVDADPEVQEYNIEVVETDGMPQVITTQHVATLEILRQMYPVAEVLEQRNADGTTRNLSAADVTGKHVIGVLPPFLVAVTAAFTSVSIKNYNAVTDGDLSGDELRERLVIAEKAIRVTAL